jgi:hypothetical protein
MRQALRKVPSIPPENGGRATCRRHAASSSPRRGRTAPIIWFARGPWGENRTSVVGNAVAVAPTQHSASISIPGLPCSSANRPRIDPWWRPESLQEPGLLSMTLPLTPGVPSLHRDEIRAVDHSNEADGSGANGNRSTGFARAIHRGDCVGFDADRGRWSGVVSSARPWRRFQSARKMRSGALDDTHRGQLRSRAGFVSFRIIRHPIIPRTSSSVSPPESWLSRVGRGGASRG